MSRVVRKPEFCLCENKDADQLRGNPEADQRLCFRYSDSTIPLLPKSEIPSPSPSSVVVQPGLCRSWSETPKTGFFTTRLKFTPTGFVVRFPSVCDYLWPASLSVTQIKSYLLKQEKIVYYLVR